MYLLAVLASSMSVSFAWWMLPQGLGGALRNYEDPVSNIANAIAALTIADVA